MIGPVHWTLAAMLLACGWAFAAWRWRPGSAALAISWCGAQAWWWQTGESVPVDIYRVADCLVLAVLLARRTSRLDWAVAALFAPQWWAYARMDGAAQWWVLFWLALAQMLLAGPWRARQPVSFSVSHGPLRAGSATQ